MSETEILSIYPYEPHEEYSLRGPASTAYPPHAASHPGSKAEAEEKVGWTPEVVLTVFYHLPASSNTHPPSFLSSHP